MAKVQNGEEILPKVAETPGVGCTNVTDDRQRKEADAFVIAKTQM